MDHQFWHERWENNQIAFHCNEANALLVDNFPALSLASESRVFLPLCGKTLDIPWLLSQGFRVVGAELSEVAVAQLFAELGVEPVISSLGTIKHYGADGIDIYVGDIFNLSRQMLGPVDAVYDRAALVALPAEMRERYVAHLIEITVRAPQLLITYEYDQSCQPGPPFAVMPDDVQRYYGQQFGLTELSALEVVGGLKGRCPAMERVWLLQKSVFE